jgi:transketolase
MGVIILNSIELAWKIRRHAIEMTHISHASHIASILSVADIIAVLYAGVLNYDPHNPKLDNRDRVILSKGHAGAAMYAALAEMGFFPVEELKTYYSNGSRLSGHVSHKGVPGVEFSTGSLGHGLSVGVGMALAAKKDNKKHRVFVILGDGECNEGSVWEAAMFANHFELNNLVAIIDHNKMASLDFCENSMKINPLKEKWEAFGWDVYDIDGHNHEELRKVLNIKDNKKPICIIANTIKGKGISFMENNILWHYRFPHEGGEYEKAIEELEAQKP